MLPNIYNFDGSEVANGYDLLLSKLQNTADKGFVFHFLFL